MANTVSYTSRTSGLNPIFEEFQGGRREGGWLLREPFLNEANARGIIFIQPGLIVSQVEGGILSNEMTDSQLYYVPCTPGQLYGPGTNVPSGIVSHQIDLSAFNQTITPVYRAQAHENECYCAGGALGDVPVAMRTTLATNGIVWRSN